MVLPVLPHYSCGDVNEDQLVTMPGAAQEATTPMINNLQDQPLAPFMATNNAIADADMGVDSSGTTSCFDDHEDIDIESFLLNMDSPDAGAEVETIEAAAADQPSSSATTAISSMDTDIMMRDEQNDIFAELQLFSPLTYHFNEWPDDDYTPDFSQDHAYDLCLETC
ncbi:hypothetical protein Syun_031590 [Stephania yunnanensis]|uniref:Uncharacterized protein n=1 Tax=Stephania yunnanensis TaxID=152371 RepID=A0AAP0E3W8_9MAGN